MPVHASVVVPAHNESDRIRGLLSDLEGPIARGEVEVIVVCNGCTDATAREARAFAGVTVVETPEPGKADALNQGDRVAGDLFPRLYCDADVRLPEDVLDALVAALGDEGAARAAAPPVDYDAEGATWVVRQFCAALGAPVIASWIDLHLVGRGLYGTNRRGRERFGLFPPVIADDLFFDAHFAPSEKFVPAGPPRVLVSVPRTARELLRQETRVAVGNLEYHALAHDGRPPERSPRARLARAHRVLGQWARQVRARDVVPLGVYLGVKGWSRLLASTRRRRGRRTAWR